MKKLLVILTILFASLLFNSSLIAQISKGGTPPSFENELIPDDVDILTIPMPDMSQIIIQDKASEKNGDFLRAGVSLPVDAGITNAGTWTTLRNGSKVWKLKIHCKDAQAISVIYDEFYIPNGAKLFLYNKHKTQVIGAFTNKNNPMRTIFSTELIQGDEVTLEYIEPKYVTGKVKLQISEISYAYKSVEFLNRYNPAKTTGWGSSDACEVNINCSPVGDSWQDQKRGVAEIWLRVGGGWGWCSGDLVNNTAEDGTPYFLTADHCGGTDASVADLLVWEFYFNYEAVDCTTPGTEPGYNTITGCVRRAVGPINGGSDFFLTELNTAPPAPYTPYYNGWDRTNTAAGSGASIHHPAGDIKKISTFTTTLISSSPNIGGSQTGPDSEWQVTWSANVNGWGVTEGGSSGSPIFNSVGRQVGTLSGGSSYCTAQSSSDYYGKFWYHWDQNGPTDADRLEPWLDPSTTGQTTLNGYDPFSAAPPTVDFSVTSPSTLLYPIPLLEGESADFQDDSWGSPTSWDWTFNGGTPNSSTNQNPTNIVYNAAGDYDVTLQATNVNGPASLTKTDMIHVIDPTIETCDTLIQFYGTPTMYTSANGYVGGTNEYGCSAIAEKFDNFHPYNKVTGGRFYWADADNATSPDVTFVIWGDNGSGSPGAQLATKTIPLATIVSDFGTNGYTDVTFDSDVILSNGAFFIGFEIPGIPASGDTLAIVTNNDSDGNDDTGYSLYGSWETYAAWGMSLMDAIFPIACYDPLLAPIADFIGVPTSVNEGGTVDFTDLSYGGTPTSWLWDFPGGTPNSSTAQNPSITYNTTGIYNATLTATNANGNDAEIKTSYITVMDPNTCACAELDHVPGTPGLSTTAGGYVSGNNEYFDLAKGEFFDDYAPYANLESAYIHFGHVYVSNTATNITINVWDDTGGASGGAAHTYSPGTVIGSVTVPITQIETDIGNGIATYIKFDPAIVIPGNFFIGFMIPNPTGGGDSLALLTEGGLGLSGVSSAWEQWDTNNWYDYTEAGWGGTDYANAIYPTVCNAGAPQVDFVADNTSIYETDFVNFTDASTCGPTAWSWVFDGGTPGTSIAQNPSVQYNTAGVYTVTLTASNVDGSNPMVKTGYITVSVAPDIIVNWDFPNNPDNALSDGGIPVNDGTKSITPFGGVDDILYNAAGVTTQCIGGETWALGANSKGWQISFVTTGYGTLKLSYAQMSNNADSPRDFKIQYSLNGTVWNDLGVNITLVENTWNTQTDFPLPLACEDQVNVYIRWIMTSNTSCDGTTVTNNSSTRRNFMDNILVVGLPLNAPPVADFSGTPTTLCEGETVNFNDASTNTPTSWSWTFSGGTPATSSVQNPSVTYNTAGTYTVELIATNAYGSDTETKVSYITVNVLPTPTITGTLTYCAGNTAILDAGAGYSSYNWSSVGNTQTEAVTIADNSITVTVEDANGCFGTSPAVNVIENALPTPNITGTLTYCAGNNTSLDAGAGYSSYNWSSGGNTQTETVTIADNPITVTVEDANGCFGTSPAINVTENALPTPTITGTLSYCTGSNTTLDAGAGYSTYNWSSGSSVQTETVTIADNPITVTVEDANGCFGISPAVNVTENALPTPTITGTLTYCTGNTATLDAGAGYSTYNWSSGGNTQTEAVTITDNPITVTVEDANGCFGTSPAVNVIENVLPTPTITGTLTYCAGNTATLDAGAGYSTYNWSSGGNAQTEAVTITDNPITVTVEDANGCFGTSPAVNVIENVLPTPTITGILTYCAGNNTVLDAGAGYSTYNWSSGGNTQTETVTIADNPITVTVEDANGCFGTSPAVNVIENVLPTPTITGTLSYCTGNTATLDAGAGYSTYNWSSGGNTQTEAVTIADNPITVTVEDANACFGTSPAVNVTENALPTPTITGTLTYCAGNTATLDAGAGYSAYNWSSVGNAQTEAVTITDNPITVTVEDANGCFGTSPAVNVTENANPIADADIDQTIPNGTSTLLNGSASGGSGTYTFHWEPAASLVDPNIENPTTVNLFSATIFTLTVTDAVTGCTNQDQMTVNISGISLSVTASATPSTICDGESSQLNALASGGTLAYTYSWTSVPASVIPNIENPIVTPTVTTIYTVVVDDGSNTASSNTTVIVNSLPTPTITGTLAYCAGNNASLDAGAGYSSYNWSSGGNTQTEAVTITDNPITVTVEDANGCFGISPAVNVTENALPTPTITGTLTYCAGNTATLDAGAGYSTYNWSSGGNTQTEAVTITDNPINVTVEDANGCFGTSPAVNVTENVLPTPTITGTLTYCAGNTATLDAGAGYSTYNWSSGGNAQTEAVTITDNPITVTVEDANGCFGISPAVNVTENVLPTPTITGTLTYCEGNSATLDAGIGYSSYNWSSGGSTQTEAVTIADNPITVTVEDANGCFGTSPAVNVTENALPTPTITGTLSYCTGNNTVLDAGAGYSTYNWSSGGNTQTETVTIANNPITVTVEDANGCFGTSPAVNVTENALPTPTITGTLSYCIGNNAVLDAGAGYSTYNWSSGGNAQTEAVTIADNPITVTVEDVNGCFGTSPAVNVTENPLPTPTITGALTYCAGNTATLDAGAGYSSYSWSSGGNAQTEAVTIADNPITVTVENANGCFGTSPAVNVTENDLSATTNTTNATCGNTDGTATVNPLGGTGSYTYVWDINTGNQTTQTATGLTGGFAYWVTVDDGLCSISVLATVNQDGSPIVTIVAANDTICEGEVLQIIASGADSYIWSPSTYLNSATNDTVYSTPYVDITYLVVGTTASCTAFESITITVNPLPIADFTHIANNLIVDFTNMSSNATSYSWDFGDSNTSTDINPSHTYTSGGSYYVELIATNNCGNDTIIILVDVITGINGINTTSDALLIYPNPNNGSFELKYSSINNNDFIVQIINITGQKVFEQEYSKDNMKFNTNIDLNNLAKGVYQLQLIQNNKIYNARIVIDRF